MDTRAGTPYGADGSPATSAAGGVSVPGGRSGSTRGRSLVSVSELPIVRDSSGPDRTPPNDVAAEQSVLGAMLLSKDAIADVVEVLREGDFYRPAHAGGLRGGARPVRPRRACRRGHRRRRADQVRRHRPGRRCALPAHPGRDGPYGGERQLLRPHRPRAGHPAPPRRGRDAHRLDGLRRHRRRRHHGRPRPGRGLRRHGPAHERGLRAAQRHHGRGAQRDRGDLQPRRRDGRRADRIQRPRSADERPAPGPAHHRGGEARDRQVDPGSRHRPIGGDQAQACRASSSPSR